MRLSLIIQLGVDVDITFITRLVFDNVNRVQCELRNEKVTKYNKIFQNR